MIRVGRAAGPKVDERLVTADFDYELPPDLIAQTPLPERDGSRMLVLDRQGGRCCHSFVRELPRWLEPGDVLVANNSRVIPARLSARRESSGGRVELLLLRREADGTWTSLVRPARRVHPGLRLLVRARSDPAAPNLRVVVERVGQAGEASVRIVDEAEHSLDEYGETPLPPYIRQPLSSVDRYQTVYASRPGSAAAPTAGLHFTPELLVAIARRRIEWAEVTLHIGLDTFRPVTEERVAEHPIHSEWCVVSDATARLLAETRRAGRRIVAVGTTAARTLETLGRVWNEAEPAGMAGMTDLFIVPGYRWRMVDALLTNFHLPRSTLLMMVSSFAGREQVMAAYAAAIAERYRFYSFGDAMLIL